MIFTDTSSPLDLDMVVLQDCRGPATDGSGWFARVLRTPANRGETHGPEGECVVTGFVINTTICLKSQSWLQIQPYVDTSLRMSHPAEQTAIWFAAISARVLHLLQQLVFSPRRFTSCIPRA